MRTISEHFSDAEVEAGDNIAEQDDDSPKLRVLDTTPGDKNQTEGISSGP